MDGFDFFRRVFGMPGNGRGNAFKNPPWDEYDYDEWDELDDVELPPGNGQTAPGFSFRVFSGDPFDMHRDFEKQMDEVMRTFMGLMGPIQQFPVLPDEPALPHIEGDSHKHNFLKPAEDLPRNRYLKPTYESSQSSTARADSDLDGRITGNELDSLFDQAVTKPVAPKTRFFGQSTFSKTVRGPDGRVEHHKTFKSSDGTEQTVITRQLGEQSHSVTVKKNQDGTTEQLEDFINMDEGDLNKFNQIWDVRRGTVPVPALVPPPPPPREDSNSWASKFLKWFK